VAKKENPGPCRESNTGRSARVVCVLLQKEMHTVVTGLL